MRVKTYLFLVAIILFSVNVMGAKWERLVSGLSRPVFAASPPGDKDRLFIVEQHSGKIVILDLKTSSLLPNPLLTISDISTSGEQGLLGLAFHPDYSDNGFFYINFTDSGGDTNIHRYHVSSGEPNSADPDSKHVILQIQQPQANHNGGWVGFGPDGYLYISSGDGGGGNDNGANHTLEIGNAQDITDNLLGKILRINVDNDDFPDDPDRNYGIPSDNPFVAIIGDDEIWAYGLRNPWRMSFDRLTGDLYIGDVGQNTREEINFQSSSSSGGVNYGWRLREGTIATPTGGVGGDPPSGAINPVYDYNHGAGPFEGRSVTGGYVYRGSIPSLNGHYVFADFVTEQICSIQIDRNTGEMVENSLIDRTTEFAPETEIINQISGFAEDEAGNLYIIDLSGEIFVLKNTAPVLDNTGDPFLNAITEGDINNSGMQISEILARLEPSGILDSDNNDIGIAIVAVNSDNGFWQFDPQGTSDWIQFNEVSEETAIPLGPESKVRFVPNSDFSGEILQGITFRAWDQTSEEVGMAADTTVNGGTSSFSVMTETARILVSPVNDPPLLEINTGTSTGRKQEVVIDNRMLRASDSDSPNTEIIYTMISIPSLGNLTLDDEPLGEQDTFTQDNIDNSLITYAPNDGELGIDGFGVSVSNSGGEAGTENRFEIKIGFVHRASHMDKLTAGNGDENDLYGSAVAMSEDTIVVTSRVGKSNASGTLSGFAYVYQPDPENNDRWIQTARISVDNETNSDGFGGAVDMDGDTIVVGASRDDENGEDVGAAYVFERNSGGVNRWGLTAKLLPDDRTELDFFGIAVAIDGDMIIVGKIGDDEVASGAGAAYIFSRNKGGENQWGQITKLTANDGGEGDRFGASVAIENDLAVIGANFKDQGEKNGGAAYVYRRDPDSIEDWREVRKLVADDGELDDEFGSSVAIDREVVIVGAPGETSFQGKFGAVYVFENSSEDMDNWTQIDKLVMSDPMRQDQFGRALAIKGDRIIVGAYRDDDRGMDSGSVTVFEQRPHDSDSWEEVLKITAEDGVMFDEFGFSVATDGKTVLIGAIKDDDKGRESGSAYIYTIESSTDISPKVLSNLGLVVNPGERGVIEASTLNIIGIDNGGPETLVYTVTGIPEMGVLKKNDEIIGSGSTFTQFDIEQGLLSFEAEALSGGADRFEFSVNGVRNIPSSPMVFDIQIGLPQLLPEVVQLEDSNGEVFDEFGYSVAISGTTLVVGKRISFGSGFSVVYEQNPMNDDQWDLVSTLIPNEENPGERFGESVAISGDIIVVSDWRDDERGENAGAAYIFERNRNGPDNWGLVRKIFAEDGKVNDQFGRSVAVHGDMAVVGANHASGMDERPSTGAAYLFNRNTGGQNQWGQLTKLVATDGSEFDEFGNSVDIDGDIIAVGAWRNDEVFFDSGAVYVFESQPQDFLTWEQVAKLKPDDIDGDDGFGKSLAVLGNRLAIGASFDDDRGLTSGSVYVFNRRSAGQWVQESKLTAPEGRAGDEFGDFVTIHGNLILVGAPLVDSDSESSGAIYIFENNPLEQELWKLIARRLPEDNGGLRFGKSIGMAGNIIVAGAPGKSRNPDPEFGAAIIFRAEDRFDTTSVFNLNLQHGWNLFSLPVLTTISPNRLFGENTHGIVWKWDASGFRPASIIQPRAGYLIYSSSEQVIPLSGTVTNDVIVTLANDTWDLVGPVNSPPFNGDPVVFQEILGEGIEVHEPIWFWNNGNYRVASNFIVGKGYWVRGKIE